MIKVYMINQKGKTEKTYALVFFGSRHFTTTQLKFLVYDKKFLALYFALDQFAHFVSGATKPLLHLIDNRNLTHFFHSKSIYPSPWICLDRVLCFKILFVHISEKANSADFV